MVLHEFAHQIDQADGAADGVPEFEDEEDYGLWSRAFAPAYEDFCERVAAGKHTVLDDYGAESPAEFFAVCSEVFFKQPDRLAAGHPALYGELSRLYRVDPLSW